MWKSMVWPGSSRTSHIRMNSFSSRTFWPTSPRVTPRSAATFNPNLSSIGLSLLCRNYGYGIDLDQIIWRRHLRDLDHRGCRQRRLEILRPHFVNGVEVLHVADV